MFWGRDMNVLHGLLVLIGIVLESNANELNGEVASMLSYSTKEENQPEDQHSDLAYCPPCHCTTSRSLQRA